VRYTYYLSLGSNIGDREENLKRAWTLLSAVRERGRMSSIYETEPMYIANQPRFLNAVGEAVSELPPQDMLRSLHAIEKGLGRDRSRERRMGPRTIDLDILLCGELVMESPELSIPHPRISERLFVLIPLLELAPDLTDPRTGASYAKAAASLSAVGAGGVYYYPTR
jgi:2-amino-4-hydroxy-6-hydroxymethyldihydropteridine diphosphokinase